jgi:hypothetical protein
MRCYVPKAGVSSRNKSSSAESSPRPVARANLPELTETRRSGGRS